MLLGTWDPGDCSFIHVWDTVLKKNVRLPNWDPSYSKGLSWKTAEDIRKFAHEENLRFHSDREKHAARAAFDRSLREKNPYLPFGQARKSASELSKQPQLAPGEHVKRVSEPTPVAGLDVLNVPQALPASERADDRIPDKGRRRGGAEATRRANATRARNREKQKSPAQPSSLTSPVQGGSQQVPAGGRITSAEAHALLAALAADLD
jgi:putative transposase